MPRPRKDKLEQLYDTFYALSPDAQRIALAVLQERYRQTQRPIKLSDLVAEAAR
jgi:hypothetical protein